MQLGVVWFSTAWLWGLHDFTRTWKPLQKTTANQSEELWILVKVGVSTVQPLLLLRFRKPWRGQQEGWRSQRIRWHCVTHCVSEECWKPHRWGLTNITASTGDETQQLKWTGKAHTVSILDNELLETRNAEGGEMVFPWDEHTNWLSNTDWSVLKAYN